MEEHDGVIGQLMMALVTHTPAVMTRSKALNP